MMGGYIRRVGILHIFVGYEYVKSDIVEALVYVFVIRLQITAVTQNARNPTHVVPVR